MTTQKVESIAGFIKDIVMTLPVICRTEIQMEFEIIDA
jgi:hypothetical protein